MIIPTTASGPGDVGASRGLARRYALHADTSLLLDEATMSASETRTSIPGVYKRGNRYVVRYKDRAGRSHRKSVRTIAEARQVKAMVTADLARGEHHVDSRTTFAMYAVDWLDTYQGRTGRGIRTPTRDSYRRHIQRHALPFFGTMRLTEIGPAVVKRYAQHVAEKGVGYNSVRLAVAPVRAMLATAVEDGLLRSNPARGVRIPRPAGHETDAAEAEEAAKALTEEELRRFLAAVPDEWRLFFEVLAATGLRISEMLALRWSDIDLGQHRLHVRRRSYDGRIAPPKSRYGRRSIPLSPRLAKALWQARKAVPAAQDGDPVFASRTGGHLSATNVAARVLKPAARGVVPHAPAYLRDDPVPPRRQRRPGATLAGPSLRRVHARDVRSPAARRPPRHRLP
jgi:integrase